MSQAAGNFRVGLLIPLQGPAGLFAPSCEAAAQLAVEQVNAAGGICGRQVQVVTLDGGGAPSAVAGRVQRAVSGRRIDAVTGWHISAVRQHVAPVLRGRVPYVYTSLYEGGGAEPGLICSGEVPRQQIEPALAALRDGFGLRRWCIVGNDYIWPRASARAARQFCRELGLSLHAQIFVPYGTQDFTPVVDAVAGSGAEAVLMLLVGQDAVAFNRAFAGRGLHQRVARFSPLMEETMLLASDAWATENLFAAAAYFSTLTTPDALHLMGLYSGRYGPAAPPLNNMAESCYEGILTLQRWHQLTRSPDLDRLIAASDSVGFDGPRGPVSLVGGVCQQRVYLAHADGLSFEVLADLAPARI